MKKLPKAWLSGVGDLYHPWCLDVSGGHEGYSETTAIVDSDRCAECGGSFPDAWPLRPAATG